MEDLLVDKEQWIIVNLSGKIMGKVGQEAKEYDSIVCLLDSLLLTVLKEASTMALWDKLGALYQSKFLV
jgi:hypothetical protein